MDRLLNYSFALLLVYVFAIWAPESVHGTIIAGIGLSLVFCLIAFLMSWLSLDGAAAALVVGTITFGFGGWTMAMVLLFFFLSSSVLSIKESDAADPDEQVRRTGPQVWANGFWVVFWLMTGVIFANITYWLAGAAVVAVATADTWATELGSRRFQANTTWLVPSMKRVSPGTDGGISISGMVASVLGSFCIACIAGWGFSLSFWGVLLIGISGFSGSLLDSYIGAKYQGRTFSCSVPYMFKDGSCTVDNNVVNWLATGSGGLILIVLNTVFL